MANNDHVRAVTTQGMVFMQDVKVNLYNIEGDIIGYAEIERFSFMPTLIREIRVHVNRPPYFNGEFTNGDIILIAKELGNHVSPQHIEDLSTGRKRVWERREQPHLTYMYDYNYYIVQFYKGMTEGV